MPFRLFDLPEKTIWKIFDQLNYVQLFNISHTSKKANEMMRFIMPVLNSTSEPVIHVVFEVKKFYIRIRKYGLNDMEHTSSWSFPAVRQSEHVEPHFAMRRPDHLEFVGDGRTREYWLCNMLKKLMRMLYPDSEKSVDILLVHLIAVTDLESILESELLQKSRRVAFTGGSVTNTEMTRILDTFGKKVQFDLLNVNPGSDFQYDKAISPEILFINRSNWISNISLLNFSSCRIIEITTPNTFDNFNFNFFIKYWLLDPLAPNLQYLVVTNCPPNLNQTEITDGITAWPSRVSQAKACMLRTKVSNERWEDGLDVMRMNDELAATLLVKKHFEPGTQNVVSTDVWFSVWSVFFYQRAVYG